jgi:DNA-binding transcriptional MerR regulator
MKLTVEDLADKVTAWCKEHQVVPANGQVASDTQVRTLRYYRTMGLLDAPVDGSYGERHYLQACAVRVLQAEGLPLSRIQSLLFGRSDEELRGIQASTTTGQLPELPPAAAQVGVRPESWQTWPITGELMLVSRRVGLQLSTAQLEAIRAILQQPLDPGV